MLNLHTAPEGAAVSLEEAKLHLRVDHSDDDALIASLVASATSDAEHLMGRAILMQKWQLSLAAIPATIYLQRPTVTAVDSFTYIGTDGVDAVFTDFLLSSGEFGATLVPAYGEAWPNIREQQDSVRIVFSCGYETAAAVPEPIKSWIKLRLGALYENREAWTLGRAIEPNPFIDRLLDRFLAWA